MARSLEPGQGVDPRLAAAIGGAPRTRKNIRENDTRNSRGQRKRRDKFYVNPSEIPKGYVVEWKRRSCLGKMEEADYKIEMNEAGWKYADPKQFPSLVLEGEETRIIERGGCVLMIRPFHMKKEAREYDHEDAIGQVRDKLTEIGMTGEGEAPRKAYAFGREYDRRGTQSRRGSAIPDDDGEDGEEVGHEGADSRPHEE